MPAAEIFPELFVERLRKIIPPPNFSDVLKSFESAGALSVRINTLKTSKENILDILGQRAIRWEAVPWCPEALILENIPAKDVFASDVVTEGLLYPQGLSSLIPVMVLDPKPGEHILDLCAAPGSKTTQIAARMNNRGRLQAVEAIRERTYKLKSVVSLLGADVVEIANVDGRKFRSGYPYDRILIDAPCSSEGRFLVSVKKTYAYWSPRKIKEMAHKQKGLLLSASRLLGPGGVLVYSTCTFAPEENEGVIDWFLRKTAGQFDILPVEVPGVRTYPAISEWEGRIYNPQVKNCLRILPDERMGGFFVVKMERK